MYQIVEKAAAVKNPIRLVLRDQLNLPNTYWLNVRHIQKLGKEYSLNILAYAADQELTFHSF